MKAVLPESRSYEFCFPRHDTLLQVEVTGEEVLIRATRDTFLEANKHCFIRELAAEGFIPDHYAWSTPAESGSFGGIRWMVDRSWLQISETVRAPARRFMHRLLVIALLGWTGLMTALLQGWFGAGAFFVASKSVPPPYLSANPPAGPRGLSFPP